MSPRPTPRHRAAARRRPPRVAVGAVAVAVGGVLLVGGQGTYASWTSSRTVPGAQLGAGTLMLTENPGCTAWTLGQTGGPSTWSGTSYPAAATNAGGTQYVEPNDTLSTTCTYKVTATGEHQRAGLAVTQPTISVPGVATAGVTAAVAYTINGVAVSAGTSITESNNNAVLVGVLTVAIPSSVSSTSPTGGLEGSTFSVTGGGITLRQVHS